jgi:hypothetical protein
MKNLLTNTQFFRSQFFLVLLAVSVVCLFASIGNATTITVTTGDYEYDEQPPRDVFGDAPTGWGAGSWQGPATALNAKTNYHVDYMGNNELVQLFGTDSLQVKDLQKISYFTKNYSVSSDWWLTIYTMKDYKDETNNDYGWYHSRLHANPDGASGNPNDWNLWSTDSGESTTTQLTFRDDRRGLQYFTLTQLTNGLSPGHDYKNEWIRAITFQTASNWNGFDGYIDGLTITLSQNPYGDTVGQVDLEPIPEPTTIVLMGFGLLALAGYGIRRKKKS